MDDSAATPAASGPARQPLGTVGEIEDAVDRLIERARHRIWLFDAGVSPRFNSVRRHDALRRLLLADPGHRIRIVVHDASRVVRDCPRLVNLLRDFSHMIALHQTEPEARGVTDPIFLADSTHAVHRFHVRQPRGVATWDDPASFESLRLRFEAIWAASSPAPGATVLGL